MWVILLSLLGIGLVLFATWEYGPGLSSDSVHLISAARSATQGEGFRFYNGEYMTVWPPLFPSLLTAFEKMGIGAETGARFLHALIFGIIIFLSGRWFTRRLRRPALVVTATLAMVLSVPLLDSMVMVWSEPLFTLLVLLSVLVLEKYSEHGKLRHGWLLALLLALACLQRYSGVGLVMAAGAVLVIVPRKLPLIKRMGRAGLVCGLSILPLIVWIFRNYRLDGTLLGPRVAREGGLWLNVQSIADFFTAWFLPSMMPVVIRVLLLLIILAGIVFALRKLRTIRSHERPFASFPFIAGWIAVFYVLFLIVFNAGVQDDPLGSRLLSPVFPLVMMVVAALLDRLSDAVGMRVGDSNTVVRHAAVIVFALWLAYPVAWTSQRLTKWSLSGIGYASPAYINSPMLGRLKSQPLTGLVLSNDPDAVYYHTGLAVASLPSHRDQSEPYLANDPKRGEAYVVWFDVYVRKDVFTPSELSPRFYVEPREQFSDGAIFHLTSRWHR